MMVNDRAKAKATFDMDVSHIHAAYRFFAACAPDPNAIRPGHGLRISGFEFSRPDQATSMRIELGWAFFTRLEAAFEALTLRLGLDFEKAFKQVEDSGLMSEEDLAGLRLARDLRNVLHHGNGDPKLLWKEPRYLKLSEGGEPHLDERHLQQFVELFAKAGEILARPPLRAI